MSVSKSFTAGDVMVRYEADTVDELVMLVRAFEDAPDDDEWLDWFGGDQPVEDDVVVEVKFRSGTKIQSRADLIAWWHDKPSHPDHGRDIIAYRVVGSN